MQQQEEVETKPFWLVEPMDSGSMVGRRERNNGAKLEDCRVVCGVPQDDADPKEINDKSDLRRTFLL